MKPPNILPAMLLRIACLLIPPCAVTACGDEGGNPPQPVARPDPCGPTAVPEGGACRDFALRMDERIPTPFLADGQPVSLEAAIFRPLQAGSRGTLVFHHGSTGSGSDPSLFSQTYVNKALAAWFVDRGWTVVFPQRRGRGSSGGLYDEGFEPDRSGYSCRADLALAGSERALADVDVITDWLQTRHDIMPSPLLIGGQSRGGILALVHLGRRPGVYRGAINFVGGWLGEGCGDYSIVNRELFLEAAAAREESLWLYADHDSYYSLAYSRGNYSAFLQAGGVGRFNEYRRAAGLEGHYMLNDSALWEAAVISFLGTGP